MMAMTTNSSMRVKAERRRMIDLPEKRMNPLPFAGKAHHQHQGKRLNGNKKNARKSGRHAWAISDQN
jgi:hypothetical protein